MAFLQVSEEVLLEILRALMGGPHEEKVRSLAYLKDPSLDSFFWLPFVEKLVEFRIPRNSKPLNHSFRKQYENMRLLEHPIYQKRTITEKDPLLSRRALIDLGEKTEEWLDNFKEDFKESTVYPTGSSLGNLILILGVPRVYNYYFKYINAGTDLIMFYDELFGEQGPYPHEAPYTLEKILERTHNIPPYENLKNFLDKLPRSRTGSQALGDFIRASPWTYVNEPSEIELILKSRNFEHKESHAFWLLEGTIDPKLHERVYYFLGASAASKLIVKILDTYSVMDEGRYEYHGSFEEVHIPLIKKLIKKHADLLSPGDLGHYFGVEPQVTELLAQERKSYYVDYFQGYMLSKTFFQAKFYREKYLKSECQGNLNKFIRKVMDPLLRGSEYAEYYAVAFFDILPFLDNREVLEILEGIQKRKSYNNVELWRVILTRGGSLGDFAGELLQNPEGSRKRYDEFLELCNRGSEIIEEPEED